MSTKHSPGPWEVVDGVYPCFKDVNGPSFKVSVVMWASDLTEDDYQQRMADLNLMSAAPALLAAADRAEQFISGFDDDNHHDDVRGMLRDLRAAIATATGAA